MTTVIVSHYKLPCIVCVCVFYLLALILCGPSGLTQTPGPLNSHPIIKDLSHSLVPFITLSTAPKMSNAISQKDVGK